jgi:hypothetical protein
VTVQFEFGDEHTLMSRYGYTLIQSTLTGKTIVTAPMVVNNIIAFVVIQPFDDYDSAFLYALTLNDAGIKPDSFTNYGRQSHDTTEEDEGEGDDEDDRAPIALLTRFPHRHREPALL